MINRVNERLPSSLPFFRVWLWGPFRVEKRVEDAFTVVQTAEWGGSNYPRLLLKALLCCPGRRARREALLNQLWPDEDIEQATSNLNTATTKLRNLLRLAKGQESLLVTENDASVYHLPDQSVLWVDADASQSVLEAAERLGRASKDALLLLEEAVNIFNRGIFLEGEESQWVAGKRGMRERERYRGRIWLVEAYTGQGMAGQAETILTILLEDDPFDEDILCRFMGLLCQQGMTYQALRLYTQIHEQFEQEGLEFTEATKNFAAHLQRERQIPSMELFAEKKVLAVSSQISSPLEQEPIFSIASSAFSEAITQGIIQAVRQLEGAATMAFDSSKRETLQKITASLLAMTGLSQADVLAAFSTWQEIRPVLAEQMPPMVPPLHEETLARFKLLIAHCWHLSKGKQPDIAIANAIAASSLPSLTTFAQQPSPYQQQAADLAAQWYRLCTVLGYHTKNLDVAKAHVKNAVKYSKIAGISDLIVASLGLHALVLYYDHRPVQAIETCLEAEQYFAQTTPAVQSFLYRRKAACLAQMRESSQALTTLDLAYETFHHHSFAGATPSYAEHEQFELLLWDGITRYQIGQPDTAQIALEKLDPLKQSNGLPERVRTGFLNHLVFAELQKPARQQDLERCTTFWKAAVQGAISLQSELRFGEVVYAYKGIQRAFPNEARIEALQEQLVRWT